MKGEFVFTNNIVDIKNSLAEGPFFDFSLRGNVDVANKHIDIKGHVTPELYGLSTIVKNIPLFGKIVAGGRSNAGLISASYKIKQDY